MPKRLKDMSGYRNAQGLSQLNAALQTLINAIYAGTDEVSVFGAQKTVKTFFNHGYDKDPDTNGGQVPNGVFVYVYYQPATEAEYGNWDTIDHEGFLSGRRRLVVRVERARHPDNTDTYAFYLTNHPRQQPGLRTNEYGVFTPVDPAK